jgi:hypothetical protein
MAVLTIFAEGRYQAIKAAARARQRWPARWLTDLNSAYSALLHHPLATDTQVLWHHDFLIWLGARNRASRFLSAGLRRFPDSAVLHDRLRARTLEDKGVAALEAVYDGMLAEDDPPPNLRWFAGYASLTAADFHRKAGRAEEAHAAYARSIAHFDAAAEGNPASRESADHYAALAMAGRARLFYEQGDDERCLKEIVGSFQRRPGSAGTPDGLGITPASTAQMLIARLTEQERLDLVEKVVAALGELDPELLIPPEDR